MGQVAKRGHLILYRVIDILGTQDAPGPACTSFELMMLKGEFQASRVCGKTLGSGGSLDDHLQRVQPCPE